jgi:hypothetical protein
MKQFHRLQKEISLAWGALKVQTAALVKVGTDLSIAMLVLRLAER